MHNKCFDNNLKTAIHKKDFEAVRETIKNAKNEFGQDSELFNFLLNPIDEIPPLSYAVQIGALNIAEFLIQNGAKVNPLYRNISNPVFFSVHTDDDSALKLIIKHNVNVNTLGLDGISPLFLAAFFGSEKCVKTLLEHGAEIDHRMGNFYENHSNVFNFALANPKLESKERIVDILLDEALRKLGPNALNSFLANSNVASVALYSKSFSIAKKLANAGARINENLGFRTPPLNFLLQHCDDESLIYNLIGLFFRDSYNWFEVDEQGRNCLFCARTLTILSRLLDIIRNDLGSENDDLYDFVNKYDIYGVTALFYALIEDEWDPDLLRNQDCKALVLAANGAEFITWEDDENFEQKFCTQRIPLPPFQASLKAKLSYTLDQFLGLILEGESYYSEEEMSLTGSENDGFIQFGLHRARLSSSYSELNGAANSSSESLEISNSR